MARILVADDDPAMLRLMSRILTGAGHRVASASSGLEVLAKLGLEPEDPAAELPDLIILDIVMPKSDGYTAGMVIRNRERTRRIPIIVVSAMAGSSRVFGAKIDADGFVDKPFSVDRLLSEVRSALGRRADPNPSSGA